MSVDKHLNFHTTPGSQIGVSEFGINELPEAQHYWNNSEYFLDLNEYSGKAVRYSHTTGDWTLYEMKKDSKGWEYAEVDDEVSEASGIVERALRNDGILESSQEFKMEEIDRYLN